MKRIGILFIITALATTIIFSGCGKNNSDKSESSTVESSKAKISQPVSKDNVSSKDNESSKNDESSKDASKASEKSTESKTEVESSWFDDAVFVGDSVTLKLSYYADNGSLGKAEFLCAGSLGYGAALQDIDADGNVHPTYEGKNILLMTVFKCLVQKRSLLCLV